MTTSELALLGTNILVYAAQIEVEEEKYIQKNKNLSRIRLR
jgi:hypothetical protein